MGLEEVLASVGFSSGDAVFLAGHSGFHHKGKSEEELEGLILKIAKVYDTDAERVKKAILAHPQFAGLDHERVVRQATETYHDEDKVKKAILHFPQFAGLDHERVVRQKSRIGRWIGLEREEVLELILKRPVLASYAARRDLAVIDLGRQLVEEGYVFDAKEMLGFYVKHFMKSPYVPESKRRRVSQIEGSEEPPMLKAMRTYLKNRE